MQKAAIHVPVTFEGRQVGKAEISEDGEIITAELDNIDNLPKNLREIFLVGMADGLSIGVNYKPAVASQEEKSQRWNQKTLPWGM